MIANRRHFPIRKLIAISAASLTLLLTVQSAEAARFQPMARPDNHPFAFDPIFPKDGFVNVLVMLNSTQPEANQRESFAVQLSRVKDSRNRLLNALSGYSATMYAGANWLIPALALRVDSTALNILKDSPLVSSISPDGYFKIEDAGSDAQIGAPAMWSAVTPGGYTGAGETVAILDTGVQENHPFFTSDGTPATSRILVSEEACFSGGGIRAYSLCPGGGVSATGAGAGAPCSVAGCDHGTHVAGIAAGYGGYSGGIGYSGVAIGANILPIQVFSTNSAGGLIGYFADVISGMNQVATLAETTSLHFPRST